MRRYPKVRRVAIRQASAGSTTIVEANGGRITVINYALTLSGDGELIFKSSEGTELGAFDVAAWGGLVCPDADRGWLTVPVGEDLVIETSGGVAKGHLSYEMNA